jgi:hypothetical protein
VTVVLEEEKYSSSCKYFERNGIICSHIIRAMVHLNVQVVPQQYMLERWSEAATTTLGGSGLPLDFGLPTTNTLRYNALCRKLTWLASDACFSDHTYKLLSDAVDQLAPVIAAARRVDAQHGETQGEGEQHDQEQPAAAIEQNVPIHDDNTDMLQNPARVKPKGRPSEKSKRKKPLLEQREEKAKKNKGNKDGVKAPKKGKVSKCSYCHEPGHNVQTCEWLKAAMATDAKISPCNPVKISEDPAETSLA